MLIFSAQSLAFIAVPKTGTTAVELALKPKADILFTKQHKHMTARRFHAKIAPFLLKVYDLRPDRVAAIRNPEEQIRSWYRYRTRDAQKASDTSTMEKSFDEFVLAVISDDPPAYAAIGSQLKMLTSGRGEVLVHHLFAYESQPQFRTFLNNRFDEKIVFKQRNVSPDIHAPLEPATRKKLQAARAGEFDLYARVKDAGGHLQTNLG